MKKTKTKTSSKPTESTTSPISFPSQIHNSYPPQLQNAYPNISHSSPPSGSSHATPQLFPAHTSSYMLQQLQNASSSSASGCGRCYQPINTFYLGGYCTQCSAPI